MEKRDKGRDFYAILGVSTQATTQDIKAAFRRHVLTVHPDKRAAGSEDIDDKEFHILKKAHDTLADEYKRQVYDKFGEDGLEFVDAVKQNPQAGTIAERSYTMEQLQYKIKKLNQQSKQRWFQENVNLRGATEVGTSVENIKRYWRGETTVPEVAGVQVATRVKIPISDKDSLDLGGNVGTHGGAGHGGFSVGYKRSLSAYTSIFAKTYVGTQVSTLEAGVKRTLDQHTIAKQSLIYNSRANFADMHLTLLRDLELPYEIRLKGFGTLMLGVFSGIKAGISRPGRDYNWTVQTEVRQPSVNLSSNIATHLSKDVYTSVGASIGAPFEWATTLSAGVVLSKTANVELGVGIGSSGIEITPSASRWGYSLRFPLLITPFFSLSTAIASVVYAYFLALVARHLAINPWKANRRQEKLRLKRSNLDEERKRAQKFVLGMKLSIDAKRSEEEAKGGLVIIHASYGNLAKRPNFIGSSQDSEASLEDIPEEEENDPEILQVADQLQYIVDNAELHLTPARKSNLPGFFDPVTGHENFLEVWYMFNGDLHHVVIGDEEDLHLPLKAHRKR